MELQWCSCVIIKVNNLTENVWVKSINTYCCRLQSKTKISSARKNCFNVYNVTIIILLLWCCVVYRVCKMFDL